MGYDLHITRKKNWDGWEDKHGPEISFEEWMSRELGTRMANVPRSAKQCLRAVLALTLVASTAAQTEEATTIEKFITRYRCPIVDRLERIYAKGDPKKHPDEYLIVDIRGAREHYVQCLFFARGKLYCEAASGFYVSKLKSERVYLPQNAILALARLGFSTDDSQGNFKIELDVSDPPDFVAVADLMLRALHAAYGADADTKLDLHAPYAPHETVKCIPVS